MSNNTERVICWDLDGTLGEFNRIAYDMQGKTPPDWMDPIQTRKGIDILLQDLTNQGYIHVVTTSAVKEYAEEVLKRTHLREHFLEVYARDDVSQRHWGKEYQCVADRLSFSLEEMRSRALVIGDSPGDQPMDIEGLVFLWVHSRLKAQVIPPIIEKLLLNGSGDFLGGFKDLYATALGNKHRVGLGQDITAELDYKTNTGELLRGREVVPTISQIMSDRYERKRSPKP